MRFFPCCVLLALLAGGVLSGSARAVATGDINDDRRVDIADVVLILRYAVGIEAPSAEELARADLSENAQADVNDAVQALQIIVGVRPPVPIPAPRDVRIRTDVLRSRSDRISAADGGTLSVTAADGTRFTLTVLPDSLLSDETVTLAPVSEIDGLPFAESGFAAVQVGPEGLRLTQPATLTVRPASPPAPERQAGFAYYGDGSDFHLYPLQTSPSSLAMQVMHFSGYGVASATPEEIAAQKARTPRVTEAQVRQQLATVYKGIRDRGGSATDADLSALETILRDWYRLSVQRGLDAADAIPARLDGAVVEYLTWRREVEQAGVGSRLQAEVDTASASAAGHLKAAIDGAYAACVEQNDPFRVPPLLRWVEWGALLHLDGRAGYSREDTFQKLQNCARFGLEFTSAVSVRPVEAGTLSATTHSVFPLTLSPMAGFSFSGGGLLQYISAEYQPDPDPCAVTAVTEGQTGVMSTISGMIDVNVKRDLAPVEMSLILSPLIQPELPAETVTVTRTCPDAAPDTHTFTTQSWYEGFHQFHFEDFVQIDNLLGYEITGWNPVGGPVFAQRAYEGSSTSGGVSVSESTLISLIHTPAR